MYFKVAINRINNIDWERMGTNQQKDEEWHMGEYLKRLETLIEEYGLGQIHIHPVICANVAMYLGDTEVINIQEHCKPVVWEKVKNLGMPRDVIAWYLQLARYAESNEVAARHVDVYDPLIELLEKGWLFYYVDCGVAVSNTAYMHMYNLYHKALMRNERVKQVYQMLLKNAEVYVGKKCMLDGREAEIVGFGPDGYWRFFYTDDEEKKVHSWIFYNKDLWKML